MTPEQITKIITDRLFHYNCMNWDETDCYGITTKQSLIPYVMPFISAIFSAMPLVVPVVEK